MIFFTADLHFGHANILKYCNRPFESVRQMDNALIKNWNSVVMKDDIVYVLGDLGFCHADRLRSVTASLLGQKILILGNHDELDPFKYVSMGFQSAHTSLTVQNYFLTHDPAIGAAVEGRVLCGHVHQLFKRVGRVLNIGVDVWNFCPVSLEEVEAEFEKD